ncbi:hypothetical protein L195_g057488 [Trifolium pratense]|uniref:Uncharacterized protein n=1 Tax=Trifolium pratense TaxID=57577 RepID=A0A2K3KW66_TRIPR|nr:hypothetical protein L195_g057488 [Trifolium pratense]
MAVTRGTAVAEATTKKNKGEEEELVRRRIMAAKRNYVSFQGKS